MNIGIGMAASAALLLALQGTAWAMDGGPGSDREHHEMMEQADTNHDGKVSFDEFKAFHDKRMQEHFKKMDTNGDGFIDKDEMRKNREMMREKMHERMEQRRDMRNKMHDQTKDSKPQ